MGANKVLGADGLGIGAGGTFLKSLKSVAPINFGGFITPNGLSGLSSLGGSCIGRGIDDVPSGTVNAEECTSAVVSPLLLSSFADD